MIRVALDTDFEQIWTIFKAVIAPGDTYVYHPNTSKEDAKYLWMERPVKTYVFEENNQIIGTYYIKQNRPGLGDHICSCGYMVDPNHQGQGIGTAMCEHSQTEAKALGFTGMQFNFVVSSNTSAVKLWQYLGFEIIGEIPNAYRFNANPETKESVYIMYKAI
jgi:RimJ/RimL family protein N-acetyltransferase